MAIRRTVLTILLLVGATFRPTYAADTLEAGINELAQAIVQSARETNARTIAVAPFPHTNDTCSELSNYIVDELILSLFLIPNVGLQIVERGQLRTILAELGLALTGAIDANTAQQIGRIHGVDSLIVGSLTVVGDRLRIIARIIGTETGLVYSAAATTVPVTETVTTLMSRPAAAGCGLVAGTPAPQAPTTAAVPTPPPPPVAAPAVPSAAQTPLPAMTAEYVAIANAYFAANETLTTAAYRAFLSRYGANATNPYVRLATAQLEASITAGFPRARPLPFVPPLGLQILPPLAQAGDRVAQYYLARMYYSGIVVAEDRAEAARWARMAAERNQPGGQTLLAEMYDGGTGGLVQNSLEATYYYRLAADQGYALAQAYLGSSYEFGVGGLAQDTDEAVRLYRLSVDQGNSYGQAFLGLYRNQVGMLADARDLYRLASDQGNMFGQYSLGEWYERGGGGRDGGIEAAVRLYRLAAAQGHTTAQRRLTELGR